jgi:hypothetical protein
MAALLVLGIAEERMSRTYDYLHTRMQVIQARDDELAKPEPSEAVLACCDLFMAVTQKEVDRFNAIQKARGHGQSVQSPT